MADEKILNKIIAEYENLRMKAAMERQKRIALVHAKLPRIKEIENEINKRGANNIKNIMEHPEKKDEFNSDLKSNIKRLTEEKNAILTENGIDIDFDKYKYECSICGDTGYDENGNKCTCFKQKIINEVYDVVNMNKMIEEKNFDTFSLDYYSDEKKDGISPRENMVKILGRCKNFCENFDSEDKSLFFFGGVGLGKTFMSCSVAKEIMNKGKSVLYIRATKLFALYDDYRFGRNIDRSDLDNVYDCDLLIIDDLGSEANINNSVSYLFDIVNERIASGKKMIINTNLEPGQISEIYTPRFKSRLYESFHICEFMGKDIRFEKMISR